MSRASIIFSALLVVLSVLTFNSLGNFPAHVAVHFDANDAPNGWLTREQYGFYVLSALTGLPLILFAAMAGLPQLTDGKGQIPNHEYWFAAERSQQTRSYLLEHSSWLGTMTAAVIYGMHIILLRANELSPPRIASDRVLTMIFVFSCGLVWWAITFFRHFQKTGH